MLPGAQVLPRELFDQLHPLTVVDEPDALFGALAVVGLRADPCFIEGATSSPCRPQLRLVLQPVFQAPEGVTTRDAAVHLFFEVDAPTLLEHVQEVARLRARFGGLFERPEARAAFTSRVKALAIRARLSKVTQMSVHASNEAWIFGGFALDGATLVQQRLPTLEKKEHHVSSTGATRTLTATLIPRSVIEPEFSQAMTEGRRDDTGLSAALDRLESATGHNPGTVDCGACHLASTARWHWAASGAPVDGTGAPIDASYADSRNLRALGYFFTQPAISPRVRRETAASLSAFDALSRGTR